MITVPLDEKKKVLGVVERKEEEERGDLEAAWCGWRESGSIASGMSRERAAQAG